MNRELPTYVPGVGYTLKHRSAVEKLIQHYCREAIGKEDGNGEIFTKEDYKIMCNRGKCHDMDKLLTGLSYPQLTSDYFHRMFNGHHEESMISPEEKCKYDWMEMILDMESNKYTKADKQGGGAYAYASSHKAYILEYMMPYFQLFGLDQMDTGIIQEIKDSVNHPYYESDLLKAIEQYMKTTNLHLLDGVSRIDDRGYYNCFNEAAPYRHESTRKENGTIHKRPNAVSYQSRSIMGRELVIGQFEAQLFDMDAICCIPEEEVAKENQKALDQLSVMGRKYQR